MPIQSLRASAYDGGTKFIRYSTGAGPSTKNAAATPRSGTSIDRNSQQDCFGLTGKNPIAGSGRVVIDAETVRSEVEVEDLSRPTAAGSASRWLAMSVLGHKSNLEVHHRHSCHSPMIPRRTMFPTQY